MAAENGVVKAQYNLGMELYQGKHVEKNVGEAFRWFRKAAEQGHAGAQYVLGSSYCAGKLLEKNYTEGVRWLRKAAEQGHAKAQFPEFNSSASKKTACNPYSIRTSAQ